MGRNQLLGGHLLETSSSGARKPWGSKVKFGRLGKSAGSLLSRRLPGGSALRGLSTNFFSRHLSTPSATKAITGTLGATTLLLLSAFLFPYLPEQVSAEEQGTTATLALDTSVAISVPSEVTVDANPTPEGEFSKSTVELGISTNNYTGYDLYLSAADGDNVLRNENPTIEDVIYPTTDGTKQAEFTNNTWGYSLSGGSSTQIPDTYNAVPKDGTTALDSTTAPSTTNYNLTFGAKVDTSIASGTYSSEVIISAVAKPVLITINFNGNGATSGSMSPIQVAVGGQVKLPANTYTKTDEVFTGWNTQADGGGTSYDDQATYTASTDPSESDLNVTLYAQWGPNVQYMQNFTKDQCQSYASDANYTVVDSRDGSDYTVRYINGACWMTQNLRLSSTTERGGSRVLTSADSNVTRNWTFPTGSLTSGNSYTEARSTISSNTSYGGYYNYCAASAGTVCNDTTKQDADQDICPKGWKLPTLDQFSGITNQVSAFSPVYSGGYYDGSLHITGSVGVWWSATAYNSDNQYNLVYGDGSLYTLNNLLKYDGYSVRCIRSS